MYLVWILGSEAQNTRYARIKGYGRQQLSPCLPSRPNAIFFVGCLPGLYRVLEQEPTPTPPNVPRLSILQPLFRRALGVSPKWYFGTPGKEEGFGLTEHRDSPAAQNHRRLHPRVEHERLKVSHVFLFKHLLPTAAAHKYEQLAARHAG